MPVILAKDGWSEWLAADTDTVKALCQSWRGQLRVDQTEEVWMRQTHIREMLQKNAFNLGPA